MKWFSFFVFFSITSIPYAKGVEIEFNETPVREVIEAFSKLTGETYLIDPDVNGVINISSKTASKFENPTLLLGEVLESQGLELVELNGFYQVRPSRVQGRPLLSNSTIGSQGLIMFSHYLKHTKPSSVIPVLSPVLDQKQGESLVANDASSVIIGRIKRGNEASIIKVIELVDKELITHSINLVNTSSFSALKALEGFDLKDVNISEDEAGNRLVINGAPHQVSRISSFLNEFDSDSERDSERLSVYSLNHSKSSEMILVLREMLSQSMQERITLKEDNPSNSIVINANSKDKISVESIIRQLDKEKDQVAIEAIIVEVSDSLFEQIGVDWAAVGSNGVGFLNLSNNLPLISGSIQPSDVLSEAPRGLTVGGSSFGNTGWGALLNALTTHSGANILSTPRVMTMDNQEARIVVGREVPFQTGSFSTTAGSGVNPFTTIERKSVGVKLKVRPQVSKGGKILLDIDQETSDVLDRGDAVDIETSMRQIVTRVVASDGEVVVLGGLKSEKETDINNKVPLLGDIPWVGGLFRSTSVKTEKVNLIVFIRPQIMKSDQDSTLFSNREFSDASRFRSDYPFGENRKRSSIEELVSEDLSFLMRRYSKDSE
ncbi:MAG: hypothetical protein IBX55_01195 [Methyloprofundus sp.]|nr:hypothetical protein [Methyloprofundus sp.]